MVAGALWWRNQQHHQPYWLTVNGVIVNGGCEATNRQAQAVRSGRLAVRNGQAFAIPVERCCSRSQTAFFTAFASEMRPVSDSASTNASMASRLV